MSSIITALLALSSIATAAASSGASQQHRRLQNATATTTAETTTASAPTMCSCSPTVLTFVLSLDQTCDDNDIEDNAGIDGSFCFTEEGVVVPEPQPVVNSTDSTAASMGTMDEPVRKLQVAEPVTEIVSVQFLEFDTSGDLTVINQDDTYADVSLSNGDRLKFNSASSFLDTSIPLADQMSGPALVPGGASLILYGKTASGTVVRNRFFWMYDMNCGTENEPLKVDDEIGWVTVISSHLISVFHVWRVWKGWI